MPHTSSSVEPSLAHGAPRTLATGALQVLAVLAVFALLASWPVPDVNEPHYLGKARHYWQADYVPGDFFFDAADAHPAFTLGVGWLSFLPRDVYAWAARLLVWGLQAFCWYTLWNAISRRAWLAPLAAGLFVLLAEQGEMAGEWAIGGAEAKGVAYAFVFLGMAALAQARWNAVWCWFGLAALFHVLVGGWSAVAAAVAWLLDRERAPLASMFKGLIVGALLAAPSLYAALALTWQSDPATVRAANSIYVYGRLAHHLDPMTFQWLEVRNFLALTVAWLMLAALAPRDWLPRTLRWFVTGTLGISLVGLLLSTVTLSDLDRHAALMRFYWFRLADAIVPLGVALVTVNGLARLFVADASAAGANARKRRLAGAALAGVVLLVAGYTIERVWSIATVSAPRSFRGYRTVRATTRGEQFSDWQNACAWIAANTPPEARFLTPRMESTFKWYAERSEVATWKDVPQDAASLLEWQTRLENIFRDETADPTRWHATLAELRAERLRELADTYDASYLLVEAEPRLALDLVYQNNSYAVYRLDR